MVPEKRSITRDSDMVRKVEELAKKEAGLLAIWSRGYCRLLVLSSINLTYPYNLKKSALLPISVLEVNDDIQGTCNENFESPGSG